MGRYFLFAVSVAILAGCSKVGSDIPEGKIRVSFKDNSAQKSVLNADYTVSWEEADVIAIYDGTDNNKFTYNKDYGVFYGTVSTYASQFYAVYPALYDKNREISAFKEESGDVVFRTFLSSCQNATDRSGFNQFVGISACKPSREGTILSGTMLNLGAMFQFTLSRNDIRKVLFRTKDGKKLSGLVYVTFSGDADPVAEGQENDYVEVCKVAGGENGMNPGTYYAVVLPGDFSAGIRVVMTDTAGNVYEKDVAGFNIARSQFKDFGTLDSDLVSAEKKLSLYYDFAGQSNIAMSGGGNFPDQQPCEWNITLTVGEKEYTTAVKDIYKKANTYFLIQGASTGYLETPAIDRMVLTEVAVTWRGHTDNHITIMSVRKSNDDYLSGIYKTVKTVAWDQNKYTVPMCGTQVLHVTHIFRLGELSAGEASPGQSLQMPEVATRYRVGTNANGASCLESIELTYAEVDLSLDLEQYIL